MTNTIKTKQDAVKVAQHIVNKMNLGNRFKIGGVDVKKVGETLLQVGNNVMHYTEFGESEIYPRRELVNAQIVVAQSN